MSTLDLEFDSHSRANWLEVEWCAAGHSENESDSVLLERRWFAAHKAAHAMRAECEVLREKMNTAQANWRDAMTRLANLNALCDALERQYASDVEPRRAAPTGRLMGQRVLDSYAQR